MSDYCKLGLAETPEPEEPEETGFDDDPTPRRWDVRWPDGRIETWGVDPAKPGAEYTAILKWTDSIPAAPLTIETIRAALDKPMPNFYDKF